MCGGYCRPRVSFVMDVTRWDRWMGTVRTGMPLVHLSVRRLLTSATTKMKMYLRWIKARAERSVSSFILYFRYEFYLEYLSVLVAYTSCSLTLSENLIIPPFVSLSLNHRFHCNYTYIV